MRTMFHRTLLAMLTGMALAALLACGSNAKMDPWLQERLNEIDAKAGKAEALELKINNLEDQIAALEKELELSGVTTGSVGAPELGQVRIRLEELEKKVAALGNDIKQLSARPAAPVAAAPAGPVARPAERTPAPPSLQALEPARPAPQPAVAPGRPTLVPYDAQPGDTLDGLARKFNVPIAEIRRANPTLRNVQPAQELVAQRYYIPKK